jgi:hypothetical protein
MKVLFALPLLLALALATSRMGISGVKDDLNGSRRAADQFMTELAAGNYPSAALYFASQQGTPDVQKPDTPVSGIPAGDGSLPPDKFMPLWQHQIETKGTPEYWRLKGIYSEGTADRTTCVSYLVECPQGAFSIRLHLVPQGEKWHVADLAFG